MDTTPTIVIDSVFLFTAWGVLSSLLASYVPGFREWFAKKTDAFKQLIMLCGILLIAVGAILLTHFGIWYLVPLTKEGLLLLGINIFLAISSNQGTYKITPVATTVRIIKEQKDLARLVSLSAGSVVKPS